MTTPIPPDRPSPENPTGTIIVHVFGRTDVGRTREHNEDSFVVADLSNDNATLQPEVRTHVAGPMGSLFMVADGMGGAAAGEIASAMATDVVLQELRINWMGRPDRGPDSFARSIKAATKIANERINQFAVAHPEYRGMGTTATIAGLLGDTLYVAQVGDSRGYIIRDGSAIQITKDQSLMQKLVEAGELTEEEAEHSDRRNIILQALGPEPTVKVDLTYQVVRRGDTLVLCSDGLSTQISKEEIARVVTEEDDLTNACRRLIDRANENGGPDNITVIVARFEGEGLSVRTDGDEIGHRSFPLADSGRTPAMPIDRVMDTATRPVPVTERPTPLRTPRAAGAATDDASMTLLQSPPMSASAPLIIRNSPVSPPPHAPPTRSVDDLVARREIGMRPVVYALVALLLIFAAWLVLRFFGGDPSSAATTGSIETLAAALARV